MGSTSRKINICVGQYAEFADPHIARARPTDEAVCSRASHDLYRAAARLNLNCGLW